MSHTINDSDMALHIIDRAIKELSMLRAEIVNGKPRRSNNSIGVFNPRSGRVERVKSK